MKKQWFVALAAFVIVVIGMGSLVPAQGSEVIVSVPGRLILQDSEGDFLLRNCDPDNPFIPCSVPPWESIDVPGYLDIRQAGITQIGRRTVDLTINLYEPIPAEPPYQFVQYYWQFEGGCVGPEPIPGDKAGIHVSYYNGGWTATWLEITNCSPRESELGGPVPFVFTDNGLRVRVPLDDLLTAIDTSGSFIWHAGVRLVRFSHPIFTRSVGVDHVPDVLYFSENPPPYLLPDEPPATWEPR